LLAGLFIAAPSGFAQVAAPSLVPFSFVTENPAAMQWGTPSRVGAASLQAQQVTSPSSSNDNFGGYSGGFRIVGKHFSVAAEGEHLESTNKPYGPSESQDTVEGAIAVGLWDWLAIGAGQSNFLSNTVSPNNTNSVSTSTSSIGLDSTQGGISIRIGEWFFLGGGGGQESGSLKVNVSTLGQTTANALRNVTKYGVGIRTGGSVLTHFEFYEIDRTKFSFSSASGPLTAQVPTFSSKETQQTGVAEVNFGGFLLAYLASHTARDSGFNTTDEQQAAIGYAPVTGFTVVIFGTQTVEHEPSGLTYGTITFTKYGLALTYLFNDAK
jgi:hypothetical protein